MQRTEITDSIVRATARLEENPDGPRTWSWVAASVWTDRMLAALGNGVRGRKWHSFYRWPNTFFAEHGLFTLHEAHVMASQSR